MLNIVYEFTLGALVMATTIAGLFFLRFWRRTGDRLFALFAIAFWMIGLNWLLLAFTDPAAETRRAAIYLVRLLAFVLILIAIIDKNRRHRSTS
jgi:hypothetical protein